MVKVKATKEIAEQELKSLQDFYKQYCRHFEIDELEELVVLHKKLTKLYLSTDQVKLYQETMIRCCKYDLLLYLAKQNGWMEVTDLNFTVSHDKNVKIVLEYLKNLNK